MLEVCDTDKNEVTASVLTEQDFSKELPLVSVIVPVYKVEKYLSECVDSILKQTYKTTLWITPTKIEMSNEW